eukprot:s5055_g1.t1
MSYTKDSAVFKERARNAGLEDGVITALCDSGIDTIAKISFCSSYLPGNSDEAPMVQAFKTALKRDPTQSEMAAFRYLYHECYAIVSQEMKILVEKSADVTEVRRLTNVERADRYKKQTERLSGLNIKGFLEPSDALIDLACTQYDNNRLAYIPWERCTSRTDEQEKDQKKDPSLTVDVSSGKLKLEKKKDDILAEVNSDLRIQHALQRRALAYDQANVVSYHQLSKWHDKLLKARLTEPPPGYSRVTYGQMERADRKFFAELCDQTRSGIQTVGTARPVEGVLKDAMFDAEVLHCLQPLPASSAAGVKESHAEVRVGSKRSSPAAVDNSGKAPKGCTAESGSDLKDESMGILPDVNVSVVLDRLAQGDDIEDASQVQPVASLPSGPPVSETLFVLELCAGSAMLSAILHRDGFSVIPVDFSGNRHRPHVHVLSMDLRDESTWRFLEYAVVTRRVVHVHAGPPCGTCSRARGIRLENGKPGPQPLRDEASPLGFDWLTGDNLERVRSANLIYLNLARFVRWLHSMSIGFSIENPTNSLLWWIPAYQSLLDIAFFVNFDACMHGSDRLKHTSFLTTVEEFRTLGVQCDGNHSHKPWGVVGPHGQQEFATAQEAAYPKALCEAISECLKLRSRSLGFEVDSLTLPCDVDARVAAQRQPRRKQGPPLMSEFKFTQTVTTHLQPVLDAKSCLREPFCDVPLDSKLIRRVVKAGDKQSDVVSYTFGIYRTPVEFLNDAKLLKHPFDTTCALPDAMLTALCFSLQHGLLGVMKQRLATLQKWRMWGRELEQDEIALHNNLHPGVAKVLAGKKLLLLEKIATDLGWADSAIHNEIREGFRLTGNPQPSGVFDPDFKPAIMEEKDLLGKMKYLKHALWTKIHHQNQQDFSQAIWDITAEECEVKGWLNGPFSWEQLEQRHQGQWMPCRRFAVWQSSKWRPIDDLSENGVNSAYTVCEKINLRALDETIWMSLTLMRLVRDKGGFSFTLSDGSTISGKVHKSWYDPTIGTPYVKTMDLKSAYKQWAIAPCDVAKAVLALKNPKDDVVYGYECLTLPFGSVASVICFNRIARLYQRILNHVSILAANYFDDFPIVEFGGLRDNTESTLKAVSDLLGFTVAFDKDAPFSRKADLLGVTLDLTDDSLKCVRVANKASRVADMKAALTKVLADGFVVPAALPSLFGRLQFCEAQLLGRQGRLAMADLRYLERVQSNRVTLTADQTAAFMSLLERLTVGQPRTIYATPPAAPCLVFTDGACEPVEDSFSGAVGGVLIRPTDNGFEMRAFGCFLDDDVMREWSEQGKRHLIGPITEIWMMNRANRLRSQQVQLLIQQMLACERLYTAGWQLIIQIDDYQEALEDQEPLSPLIGALAHVRQLLVTQADGYLQQRQVHAARLQQLLLGIGWAA